MAHNILAESQFASIRSAWHRLGSVGAYTSATEGMNAANMNWRIYKQPLYAHDPNGGAIATNAYGLMREPIVGDDAWKFLGSCSAKYDFWQNVDMADRVDLLAEQTGWGFETIGALGDGETLFISLAMGDSTVNGNQIKSFFTMIERRDGRSSASAIVSPVCVVCANTLQMATKAATGEIKIRHDAEFKTTADWALSVVADAQKANNNVAEALTAMGEITFNQDDFTTLLDAILPMPTMPRIMTMPNLTGKMAEKRDRAEYVYTAKTAHVNRARAAITGYYDNGMDLEDSRYRGTGWAAYQAVTRYTTHDYGKRDGGRGRTMSDEGRATSDLFGDGAALRNSAAEFILSGF